MRVLFLDQFSHLGGAQQCLREVLIEARRRGWEAEVMAPGDGALLTWARGCGCDVSAAPLDQYPDARAAAIDLARFSRGMLRMAQAVRRALRDRPPDVIYINGPRVLPAAIGLRVPVVFHAHSVLTSRYARAAAGFCLRSISASVLACSQFAARAMQPLTRMPVHVVYNGVADCGFQPRPPQRAPLKVGFIGRIAPEKGHLDFIAAAKQLAGAAIEFHVAGAALFSDQDYEREVRRACRNCGIHLHGWQPDISGLLRQLDIVAVPSAAIEASTRVVAEAFSAGACVVAYPSGGLPELIDHGETGLLTKTCEPAQLAQAIVLLAQDYALRTRLTQNARAEFESRFTVARFQREVCDWIADAATRRQPAATAARSATRALQPERDAPLFPQSPRR
jgi:glycosyltransferase involved in cell wall biosynthesis